MSVQIINLTSFASLAYITSGAYICYSAYSVSSVFLLKNSKGIVKSAKT